MAHRLDGVQHPRRLLLEIKLCSGQLPLGDVRTDGGKFCRFGTELATQQSGEQKRVGHARDQRQCQNQQAEPETGGIGDLVPLELVLGLHQLNLDQLGKLG
ncbi:hypothetical protein D9M70_579700 [compost metagenome]